MASRPSQFERRELAGVSWLILLVGIAASIAAWHVWRESTVREFRHDLQRTAAELSQRIGTDLRQHDQVLTSAAGLFAASRSVTRDEFSEFARAVDLRARFPDARSMAWIRGEPRTARVHYASSHSDWATPGERVFSVGGLALALKEARDSGRAVLVRTYSGRTGAPADFVLAHSVYATPDTPAATGRRRALLEGWVVLKLRGRGFLERHVRAVPDGALAVLVSPLGELVSGSSRAAFRPDRPAGSLTRVDPLHLFGRDWKLRTTALPGLREPIDRVGPNLALFGGLALSLILFALLRLRRRAVVEARARSRDLHENEEQFRALATSSPVGVCLLDEAGECRYVNQRWADVHGVDPEEALGRGHLPALTPGDETIWEAVAQRARMGDETAIEGQIERPDGEERWVSYRGAPMLREDGGIRGWVVSADDVTERHAYEGELKRRALHDELTGLPNRALVEEQLARALAASARQGGSTGVLFIDLDRFKLVNDSLGHASGDQVIRTAARRLDQAMRPGDTVGRFAGDEFVVVCEDIEEETDVLRIAERIVADLGAPTVVNGHKLSVSASVGVAFGRPGDDPAEVLRDADTARYQAKLLGGGGIEIIDANLKTKAQKRLELENELREAVDGGGFEIHYQPLVELPSRRPIGFEALLRWRRGGELVGPNDFIPIAEETGLIVPIGRWVLHEACEQAARWNNVPGGRRMCVSVNVSARQIVEPGLPETVTGALAASGLDPECLSLEITESVVLESHGDNLATLERLERLGVRLSVDDFGTGYSSLSYLKKFPIHELKIDRAFVMDMARSAEDCELVAAIVAMAEALGFAVLAEGVETEEQLEALRGLRVKLAQGYLFSRPLPVADAETLVRSSALSPAAS